MLDESPTELNDLTMIDAVRAMVLKQDPWASYITIAESENGLNGVVCYRAEYLAYNQNINALVCLFDAVSMDPISSFLSICAYSGVSNKGGLE